MQQPMINLKDIFDATTAINMALVLIAKAFKLNYSSATNNNKRISSNPHNMHIAQPGMNMGQDRQMQMVRDLGVQNVGNQNRLIVVSGIANPNGNQIGNGNVVAARAEGNGNRNNEDLDEIKEVNANCILMANLQQASTSGTQIDKAPIYDSDGSAEVHEYDNCYNNTIFNMFTQEEQYTDLLEPIREPHQVQQNDNNVISTVSSVEQSGETVEQHPATIHTAYSNSLITVYRSFDIAADHAFSECMGKAQAESSLAKPKIDNNVKIELSNEHLKELQSKYDVTRDDEDEGRDYFEFEAWLNAKFKDRKRMDGMTKSALWNYWLKGEGSNELMDDIDSSDEEWEESDYENPHTLDPLSQKLEDENVELEFQVLNYAKENAHLKTIYKNLFDSINVTQTQTKSIIDSLQEKLHNTIYENAKLRAQLFDKVSKQKDTTQGTSANTKFTKQSILGKPPSSSKSKLYSVTPFLNSKVIRKVSERNALLKPVTSNSAPSTQESKVVKNDNVIAPGMFRINPSKISRLDNVLPNKHVKVRVESTAKTRRPQPRSNTKNDRVPSASKSSCIKNKDVEMNVKTAFLHGLLKEDVYVCQPEGFIDADRLSHVYKLKKALYGLKQASRAWYDELSKFLLQNHFFKGTIDPTLFIRRFDDDILVDFGFELTGFSYADYEGCQDFFNSTSGGTQFLSEKLVGCPLDADIVNGLWLSLSQDSYLLKLAIAISCNPVQHSRTKHIAVRYYFIMEHMEKGTIELHFVKTDYQLADLFTKSLPMDRFN
ncbi:integrase, catalytic region, zinc finger, CCHC-type containing protein [Tanacetum coccineum]